MTLKIPTPTPVPGYNGPPTWWSAPPSPVDLQVNDPRWSGALAQGYGTGTGPVALLRILTNGQDLLLSWQVFFDPKGGGNDLLWVGVTTAHGDIFLHISLKNALEVGLDHAADGAYFTVDAYKRKPNPSLELVKMLNPPAWISSIRVWRKPEFDQQVLTNAPWAVQVRIPIIGTAIGLDDDTGVQISTADFRLWTYAEHALDFGPEDGDYVMFSWPYSQEAPAYSADDLPIPPASAAWSPVSFTHGDKYVEINDDAIGVEKNGVLGGGIDKTTDNVFVAKPRSHAGSIGPKQIEATFRLANWGTEILVDGTWDKLSLYPPGPNSVKTTWLPNQGNIAGDGNLPQASADIRGTWTKADMDVWYGLKPRQDHQCLYVELRAGAGTPGGVTFSRSSVWRNMNFVQNSVVERVAHIDLRAIPAARRPPFVGLAVQTRGMSAKSYKWSSVAEKQVKAHADDPYVAKVVEKLSPLLAVDKPAANVHVAVAKAVGSVRWVTLEKLLPSFKVHVYYPTGQVVRKHGKLCRVFALAPSFGLFGVSASTEGWATLLSGAARVANNFYALKIPKFGRGVVSAHVQGIHVGEPRLRSNPIRRVVLEGELLRHVVDRVDRVERVLSDVVGRARVVEEVDARVVRIHDRVSTMDPVDGDSPRLVANLVARSSGAHSRWTAVPDAQKRLSSLERRASLFEDFLDALYAFDESEIDAVIARTFPDEDMQLTITQLEQQAHTLASALVPILDQIEAEGRTAEQTLSSLNEHAVVLKRVERDLDRRAISMRPRGADALRTVVFHRPPGAELEPMLERREVASERSRGPSTFGHREDDITKLSGTFHAVERHLDRLNESHREMASLEDELGRVNEDVVRWISGQLRAARRGG